LKIKGQQQQTCDLCGRVLKTSIIKQKVGGTYYIVDKDECAIILKRLHSVYGNDFCMMLKE
jgi:folate-binding Fe-S cluster repair protein YgfZ